MIGLIDKIKQANEIAIISHIHPDGDTLGSSTSMYNLVRRLDKSAYLLCEDTIPQNFSFLDGYNDYSTSCHLDKVDLCFAMDTATISRLGKFQQLFLNSDININIDHHISNIGYGQINHIVPTAASTCQICFDLYKDEGITIDKSMGKSLYTGMSTDTGHFMHSNVTETTFLQAAEIVRIGVDIAQVSQALYKENSKKRTQLLAKAISSMQWFENDKICIITITQDDLELLGCEITHTEGIVNYALNIRGVQVGVLITESKPNVFKISLRAKPGFDVDAVARDFGGGGHILAAGCMIYNTKSKVIASILQSIKNKMYNV